MMNRLENLLKAYSDITIYKITENDQETYELYFVHENLETTRSTDTKEFHITVYVAHDEFLGDSKFSVKESQTDDEIKALIEANIEKAKLINNPTYHLPKDSQEEMILDTNLKDYSFAELGQMISDTYFEAVSESDSTINALEVFIYKDTLHIKTSQNIDKKAIKYSFMVEAIPTYTDGESVELYEQSTFTVFDKAQVKENIKEKLDDVKARFYAKKLEGLENTPVILRAADFGLYFYSLYRDVNFATVFSESNLYKIGDLVQKDPKYDKITMTLRGVLPTNNYSLPFDDDGAKTIDTLVIDNSKVVANFGSYRYATYLDKTPTGNLRVLDINPGSYTKEELFTGPYLEIVSMSGMQIEEYSDYIGGEVRLAKYHNGTEMIPVTGFSISAKLSDVINTIKMSKEMCETHGCHCPKYTKIDGFKIF